MLSFAPAAMADRRLLPERGTWLTPWLVGVLMFVTVVVGASGLALANAAAAVARGAEQRWSVQLPGGARLVPAVAEAARRAPGVASVTIVPDRDVRRLLEQWLGPDLARSAELPVPGLIDVELAPAADPEPLRQRIAAVAPGARLLPYAQQLGPLRDALRTLQWLALGVVLLMVLATGAAVMLATRGAYDTHRSTVAVLHGIGATDAQLARLFQGRMAREAMIGATAGTILALLLVLALLAGLGGGPSFVSGPPLGPFDLVLLGALPFGAGLLALLVARTTVLRALRADP